MTRKLPADAQGLQIQVYRPVDFPDCTLDGISSKHSRLTVIGVIDDRDAADFRTPAPVKGLPKESRISAPTDQAPAAILRIRRMGNRLLYTIEPYQADGGTRWYMAGGNYAGTVDSRFGDLTGHQYGAFSVHDRHEG